MRGLIALFILRQKANDKKNKKSLLLFPLVMLLKLGYYFKKLVASIFFRE